MASKILKRLAIVGGVGLAIGLKSNGQVSKRRRESPPMRNSADDILNLEPLLDRLDRIEDRMSLLEMVEHRFTDLVKDLPAMVEAMIAPQVSEIRARLHAETQQTVETTLVSFEHAIENRISPRILAIEKALIDQSGIITTLSERAIESDVNLQRLITALEKLCERTESRPATRAKEPSLLDLPFESHLSEAVKRQQAAPVTNDPEFRPQFITEEESDRLRRRTPLTSI